MLIPSVIAKLKTLQPVNIMPTAGGAIPAQHYDFLYKAAVLGVFGPNTKVSACAIPMVKLRIKNNRE